MRLNMHFQPPRNIHAMRVLISSVGELDAICKNNMRWRRSLSSSFLGVEEMRVQHCNLNSASFFKLIYLKTYPVFLVWFREFSVRTYNSLFTNILVIKLTYTAHKHREFVHVLAEHNSKSGSLSFQKCLCFFLFP